MPTKTPSKQGKSKKKSGVDAEGAAVEAFLDEELANAGNLPDDVVGSGKTSRSSRKASRARDNEPTEDDISAEEARIAESEAERQKKRHTPVPGRDLLASYMDQLSHIPLFTPHEELSRAKELENLEEDLWRRAFSMPRCVEHLMHEASELEDPVPNELSALALRYSHLAERSGKHTDATCTRLINKLCKVIRAFDHDKALLDGLMRRVRREVWGRHSPDGTAPNPRISHAELTALERSRGKALRLRNDFVRANLRLVVSVARNFHHYRIPFIDLIQEGNVGLMKAVHRFDHKRGFRFSTYAHWWIRQSIERAIINKGSQVRLPVHVIDSRRQVARNMSKLTQDLGRTPSAEEVADVMGLPKVKVEQILSGIQQDPVSLDESVSGEDGRKFLDLVRDESALGLDEAVIRESTHTRVRELLHLLNPIEQDIIRRRFGLGDDSDQTLDEIGKMYNLSRERVRQIQAQGLQKIRRLCERRRIS